jgi:2-hydroxychromene-2-carboxylate isomerase
MSAGHVDFYFDYLSGYAYFGWLRVRSLCARKGATLGVHPVLFAGLLNHWGQLGPAEIPPKRAWVYRDGFRIAKRDNVPLSPPRYHPFNPLLALRLSLAEVGGADQPRVVDAIFGAGWGRGIDLGSREELAATLDAAGLDGNGLVAKASEPAAKAALKKSTEDAIARGVFGVPTMIVGDELFWGADRVEYVEMALDGTDPIDHAWVNEVLARPKQADRREALAEHQKKKE